MQPMLQQQQQQLILQQQRQRMAAMNGKPAVSTALGDCFALYLLEVESNRDLRDAATRGKSWDGRVCPDPKPYDNESRDDATGWTFSLRSKSNPAPNSQRIAACSEAPTT